MCVGFIQEHRIEMLGLIWVVSYELLLVLRVKVVILAFERRLLRENTRMVVVDSKRNWCFLV